MAQQPKNLQFTSFQTLNTSFPTEIPSNHFSDTMNMVRREDGMWENRKGIVQFGDTVGSGEPIHSLKFWKTSSGTRYLTVGSDTDLFSYAEGSAYNDGAYTNRKTLTSDAKWDTTVYRDTLLIGNGVDDIQSSTDNSTFTSRSGGNVVKCKFLEVGNDYVSFSGVPSDKDKVYLSSGAPANPWEYNGSNTQNVDIGNSDVITGLISLGQNIVVAKPRQTYAVALADLSRQTLDFGGGTESNRSMIRTQLNNIFYAGRMGIFSIARTQIGSNLLFGNPENQLIKSFYDKTQDYSNINGLYTPKENYGLWTCDTTLGTVTFVKELDFEQPVWTYFYGVNANDWTIYEDSDGGLHYLFADNATDKVWELFKGRNDHGAPILSRLSSKRDDFGLPGQGKFIDHIDFYGYASTNAVWNGELYKDDNETDAFSNFTIDSSNINQQPTGGLGSASLGTSPLGGLISNDGDIEVFPFFCRVPVGQSVEKIQWSLFNNQADARVILRAVYVSVSGEPTDFFATQFII